MKIELFEKIAEINMTGIKTAEENRAIASQFNIQKEKAEQEAKRKREEEILSNAEPMLMWFLNEINSQSQQGGESFSYWWEYQAKHGKSHLSWSEFMLAFSQCTPILQGLGYKVYTHEYSEGWKKRGGYEGYIRIGWWE
jgi:hypothetical protein